MQRIITLILLIAACLFTYQVFDKSARDGVKEQYIADMDRYAKSIGLQHVATEDSKVMPYAAALPSKGMISYNSHPEITVGGNDLKGNNVILVEFDASMAVDDTAFEAFYKEKIESFEWNLMERFFGGETVVYDDGAGSVAVLFNVPYYSPGLSERIELFVRNVFGMLSREQVAHPALLAFKKGGHADPLEQCDIEC